MWRGKSESQHLVLQLRRAAHASPECTFRYRGHPPSPNQTPSCSPSKAPGQPYIRQANKPWMAFYAALLFLPPLLLSVMPLTFDPTPTISAGLRTAMKMSQKGGGKQQGESRRWLLRSTFVFALVFLFGRGIEQLCKNPATVIS